MEQIKEKILIFTQVYNCEEFLPQTIESVLAQTYPFFEYHIIDNGSTDGTRAITQDFAQRDHRIVLHLFEENDPFRWVDSLRSPKETSCKYATSIDGDDWWEPDYLERLVAFAEENELDIACTGSYVHEEATGKIRMESLEQRQILSQSEYIDGIAQYVWFFQTIWNKLIRIDVVNNVVDVPLFRVHSDTIFCYELFRHSKRIGIDHSALHHYRVRKGSLMQSYERTRFEAHIYYYHYMMRLLADFGAASDENVLFWRRQLFGNFNREILLEMTSTLSSEEKLRHYREMATRPSMCEFYQCRIPESQKCVVLFLQCIIAEKAKLNDDNADFTAVVDALAPYCGEPGEKLMLREHEQICRFLEHGEDKKALEQLNQMLRRSESLYNLKAFTKGYVALAKRAGRSDLVQYGKLRLAKHYLGRGENKKCQALLDEVTAATAEGIQLPDFPELEVLMQKR